MSLHTFRPCNDTPSITLSTSSALLLNSTVGENLITSLCLKTDAKQHYILPNKQLQHKIGRTIEDLPRALTSPPKQVRCTTIRNNFEILLSTSEKYSSPCWMQQEMHLFIRRSYSTLISSSHYNISRLINFLQSFPTQILTWYLVLILKTCLIHVSKMLYLSL